MIPLGEVKEEDDLTLQKFDPVCFHNFTSYISNTSGNAWMLD